MFYRRFMWGLANGVLMLAIAGAFWMGIVAASSRGRMAAAGLMTIGAVSLFCGFLALRRKSAGFKLSELKNGNAEEQRILRDVNAGFRRIAIFETVLASVAVGAVEYLHRLDLLWPALGLAVSLHFIPVGRLFHLRTYYATAALGSLVCLIGLLPIPAPSKPLWVGYGMAAVMWGSAGWLLVRSERLAANSPAAKMASVP